MLVLSRHSDETITIPINENTARALLQEILQNGTCTVTVSVEGIQRHPFKDKVKLGFESPQCLPIVRSELINSLDGIVHQSVTQCVHSRPMSEPCKLCCRKGLPKLSDQSVIA